MSGMALALLMQAGFQVGDRVEAMPIGTRWESCVILRESKTDGGYGLRCDSGSDFFVAYRNVRAPTGNAAPARPGNEAAGAPANAPAGIAPKVATRPAPPAPPAPPATGTALPIGKTLKCYYLAGTQLNYSFVDILFTSGSAYADRRGASGGYTRDGAEIRFTSGPFAQHRAQVKPGGIALFAPEASFAMSCT